MLYRSPAHGAEEVRTIAAGAGIEVRTVTAGESWTLDGVALQTLWPPAGASAASQAPSSAASSAASSAGSVTGDSEESESGGDSAAANNASVVLRVVADGVSILLTGDLEPPGQEALARADPGLRVDVLKLPHHGSAHQSMPWLESLHAAVVLVSVGADNDYGHPNADVLGELAATGARVLRTDRDGAAAVMAEDGAMATATLR